MENTFTYILNNKWEKLLTICNENFKPFNIFYFITCINHSCSLSLLLDPCVLWSSLRCQSVAAIGLPAWFPTHPGLTWLKSWRSTLRSPLIMQALMSRCLANVCSPHRYSPVKPHPKLSNVSKCKSNVKEKIVQNVEIAVRNVINVSPLFIHSQTSITQDLTP